MTDSVDALHAALEAAGLPLQAMPEEQRAMFATLTEEEVTRLIRLRTDRSAGEAGTPATDEESAGCAVPDAVSNATDASAKDGKPHGDR